MKPFNLQDAINGKPVITRAGVSLTFGAYIPKPIPTSFSC